MLTIDYLKAVLTAPEANLPAVTNVDEQVIDSPDGLEALPEPCYWPDRAQAAPKCKAGTAARSATSCVVQPTMWAGG